MLVVGCNPNSLWQKIRGTLLWTAVLALPIVSHAVRAEEPQPQPNIGFIDAGSAVLAPDGAGVFEFDAPLKNSGGSVGTPVFSLQSGQENKCTTKKIDAKPSASMKSNEIAMTHFTISNIELPAVCYLEITTTKLDGTVANRTMKQLKFSQKYATSTVICRLAACLVSSVLTLSIVALIAYRKHKAKFYRLMLGSPAWDFAKSWSSMLTFAGGVVSAGIAISSLPELTMYASKGGYATLVLLLSLAVLVAPFFFIVIMRGEIKNGSVVYAGHVAGFFVSCGVALLAGTAQIVIFFLLLDEIFRDYISLHALAVVATVALGAALCWYCGYSMFLTIELQVNRKIELQVNPKIELQVNPNKEIDENLNRRKNDGAQEPPFSWAIL